MPSLFVITLFSDDTPLVTLQPVDGAPSVLPTDFLSSTQVLSPTSSTQVVASATTAPSGIATAPPSGIGTASSGLTITAPYVTAAPVASSKVERPLSLIIGGALGGLALLVAGFIVFMFFRRRENDRSHDGEPTPTTNTSCKFHVHLIFKNERIMELIPLQVWTSIPRANVAVVPTRTEKRPSVLATLSNSLQNSTPSPGGLHAHGACASSPPDPSPSLTNTSNQVSDSTTIPPHDLQPPQYEE